MLKLFNWLSELFRKLFRLSRIEYFDLLEEYEHDVKGIDLSDCDTLIGAVRTAEQYRINFEENFYHIPAVHVDDPKQIKYIALYRSKNIFGSDAGIKHYARVGDFELLKRCDIVEIPATHSLYDDYYRFNVVEWNCLDQPVKAREEGPRVCITTNMMYLKSVQYCYELYMSDNNELKLHIGLTDITNGIYDGFFVGSVYVRATRNKIIVTSSKTRKVFLKDDYKMHTLAVTKKIADIVFSESLTS